MNAPVESPSMTNPISLFVGAFKWAHQRFGLAGALVLALLAGGGYLATRRYLEKHFPQMNEEERETFLKNFARDGGAA